MALILGVCPATTALATIDPTEDGLLDPDTLIIFSVVSSTVRLFLNLVFLRKMVADPEVQGVCFRRLRFAR